MNGPSPECFKNRDINKLRWTFERCYLVKRSSVGRVYPTDFWTGADVDAAVGRLNRIRSGGAVHRYPFLG